MTPDSPLDSARRKAYWRLLPLLFVAYVIAYVDRQNIAVAKLTMAHPTHGLPGFNDAVIGFGAGIFFIGYFLLEIPGSLIVERWSARKWISRIMVTWGLMAALTGFVHHDMFLLAPIANGLASMTSGVCAMLSHTSIQWLSEGATNIMAMADGPNRTSIFQFVTVRFLLGLAEAGFFPGVIIYLTHWFPSRDRAKAIASFLVATPFAQVISPKISNTLLKIGTDAEHPAVLGMVGWQWVYVFWAVPAVILGVAILWLLTDRPRDAKWLTLEEREAIENELERERAITRKGGRMTVGQALRHPKVLLLALAYFCTVTGSYGIEFFMPSILDSWYKMKLDQLTWLILLPPALAFLGQMAMGWSSDRFKERRIHSVAPIIMGSIALALLPLTQGQLWLTMLGLMLAFTGFKAYMPAFWSLPSLFLTEAAAAGSIGLINSVGNLGGFLGPTILGGVKTATGSFVGGLYYLAASMMISVFVILGLGIGRDTAPKSSSAP
jgi:ACS family tartrate transporter-like MFS transporter